MKFKNWISLMILLSFIINANLAYAHNHAITSIKDDVKMNVEIAGAAKIDTLVVWVFSHLLSERSLNNYKAYEGTMNESRQFMLNFSLSEPGQYFLMGIKKGGKKRDLSAIDEVLLPCYYVEKEDDIRMQISPDDLKTNIMEYHQAQISFTGKGAMKYASRFKTDSLFYHLYNGKTGLSPEGKYRESDLQHSMIASGLKIINDRQGTMSEMAFHILQTDFVYYVKNTECESLISILKKSDRLKKTNFKASISDFERSGITEAPFEPIVTSQAYTKYKLNEIKLEALLNDPQADVDALYFMIKDHYRGELLDRVICLYFNNIGYRIGDYRKIITDALATVKRPEYQDELKIYGNRISGEIAYNFQLPDADNNQVSLNDFKGKVVIVDFWFTGCAACTKFYKEKLSKVEEKYKNNHSVVFISVCIDSGKDHWLKSVKSGNYTSDNIINLYTGGSGPAAPVIRHYNIFSYPQPVIIDQMQRLRVFGNAETLTASAMTETIEALLNN